MNFKRSTTSLAIALMAVSLFSMAFIQHDAFAQSSGMAITATSNEGSNTITVSGKTTSDLTDVTLRVTSPMNKVVEIGQVTPDADGEFSKVISVNGPLWTENGLYTITATQGISHNSLYTLKVLVEVNDGMTEIIFTGNESNLEPGIFVPETNVTRDVGLELDEPSFVNGSDEFAISGITDRVSQDITVKVTAPNGNVITVEQISPTLDGEFSKVIKVGGPLWKEDGFYTVTAQQFDDPEYTDSKQVDILDGTVVPEFGTIAAMILAVAIISIIAITARSRLSIMPRY